MLKKTLIWGGVTFVIFMAAFRPGLLARAVRTLGDTVAMLGAELGNFFVRVVS